MIHFGPYVGNFLILELDARSDGYLYATVDVTAYSHDRRAPAADAVVAIVAQYTRDDDGVSVAAGDVWDSLQGHGALSDWGGEACWPLADLLAREADRAWEQVAPTMRGVELTELYCQA